MWSATIPGRIYFRRLATPRKSMNAVVSVKSTLTISQPSSPSELKYFSTCSGLTSLMKPLFSRSAAVKNLYSHFVILDIRAVIESPRNNRIDAQTGQTFEKSSGGQRNVFTTPLLTEANKRRNIKEFTKKNRRCQRVGVRGAAKQNKSLDRATWQIK